MEKQISSTIVALLSNSEEPLSVLQSWFNPPNRLSYLTKISFLLSEMLFDHSQQIVAFWLIYKEFKKVPISEHPFLPIFLQVYKTKAEEPNKFSPQLYDLLAYVLSERSIDNVGSYSVKYIFSQKFCLESITFSISPAFHGLEIGKIISPVLAYANEKEIISEDVMTQEQLLIELLNDLNMLKDFEVQQIRLIPELTPICKEEMVDNFISSFDASPFLMDEFVSIDSKTEAISLINRATDSVLKESELNSLLTEIKRNHDLIKDASLQFNKIKSMIEFNPLIAKEIVNYIVFKMSDQLIDYLSKVPITDSIASILKDIFIQNKLPYDTLENYIRNSLLTLGEIKEQQKDKTELFCKLLYEICSSGIKLSQQICIKLYLFCSDVKSPSIDEYLTKIIPN